MSRRSRESREARDGRGQRSVRLRPRGPSVCRARSGTSGRGARGCCFMAVTTSRSGPSSVILLTTDDPIAAEVADANIWECPNLLRVAGQWVLLVSLLAVSMASTSCPGALPDWRPGRSGSAFGRSRRPQEVWSMRDPLSTPRRCWPNRTVRCCGLGLGNSGAANSRSPTPAGLAY